MDFITIFALLIFLIIYAFIILEKIHRTTISLFGAVLFVAIGVLTQKEAFAFVDWNTLLLLIGMMIIVGGLDESGFFQYIGTWAMNKTGGKPIKIFMVFFALTAVCSAFLDNVTTVLLFVPIIVFICTTLGISTYPFLIGLIVASNIGGSATLIGDPPNLIIGSAANLGFNDFVINFTLGIFIIFIILLLIMILIFKKDLFKKTNEIPYLDEKRAIKNFGLMKKALFAFFISLILFVIADELHIQPATAAIFGAGIFLMSIRGNPIKYLQKVEWETIFFFAALFILVGGLEKHKILDMFYQATLSHISSPILVVTFIVLGAGVLSAFFGNVPITAALVPFIKAIIASSNGSGRFGPEGIALWVALSFGTNLGGMGTIIGTAAGVVVMGLSQRTPTPINFKKYLKYGIIITLISCFIGIAYIVIRYL